MIQPNIMITSTTPKIMVSNFLYMLLALAVLAVRFEGGDAFPVVHFIDRTIGKDPAPVNLHIKSGGMVRGSPQLSPGQDYGMKVEVNDVYYVVAVFGLRFTEFHAYEPARDQGRTAVYWKADNRGFAVSYDKKHWKLVAAWESE